MDPYRLPRTVVPSRYDLRLEPDLNTASFTGAATITVTVREPVKEVVLNAIELSITEAVLAPERGAPHPATITLDEATERCHLRFRDTITPGDWKLRLAEFNGAALDTYRFDTLEYFWFLAERVRICVAS